MPGSFWKSKLLAAGAALLLGTTAYAETIVLRGARVLTMDDAKPEAQAIALVDGRIAAVGTDVEVEPFFKDAKIYDLPADALVLPGFQDSHNHLIWSATQGKNVDMTDVADAGALRDAMTPALAALADGAWLRADFWDNGVYADGSAAILDPITGDRPTYIESLDGHSAWVNTAALKAAGIDASTKDPEGGRIERDAQGNPTGLLREKAMELVSNLLPDYPESQVDAALQEAQAEAIGYGITAIIDPSTEEWMLKGYQRADAADKLKLRVEAAIKVEAGNESPVGSVIKLKNTYTGPHLEVTSVKLFVDGVIETGTAALLEAYVGSNSSGELLFTQEELNEVAIAADAVDLQLHAHAIGDRAVRATLDAYEAAQKANGERDSRHQITHVQLVDPADIPRFKELGVIANIQALWAYPDTYIVDLTQPKIGPERSEWLYPFGALKEAGAILAGSSDWSVSSMNPLEAIQTGVTRQDIADPNGAVLTPQHKLDVMDMLRAYTVNGAYAAFDEAESGTLTKGKRADVVVLDKDVTKAPATEIASAKVLLTLIDGEPAHEGEGLPKPTGP